MSVTASRGTTIVNTLVDQRPRGFDARRAIFRRRFETLSPVWDPAFRNEIAAAMAPIDAPDVSWVRIRIARGHRLRTVLLRTAFALASTVIPKTSRDMSSWKPVTRTCWWPSAR
ncbi:MAG: hypothetical protein HQ523_08025 [Lentisphaerae bacterium]|nr:hypothetical protein [Lentisphaerota bacterium]